MRATLRSPWPIHGQIVCIEIAIDDAIVCRAGSAHFSIDGSVPAPARTQPAGSARPNEMPLVTAGIFGYAPSNLRFAHSEQTAERLGTDAWAQTLVSGLHGW